MDIGRAGVVFGAEGVGVVLRIAGGQKLEGPQNFFFCISIHFESHAHTPGGAGRL